MRKIINTFIFLFNLIVLISLTNIIYDRHGIFGASTYYVFITMFFCVVANLLLILKPIRIIGLLLIFTEIILCFYLTHFIYLGHSFHFWFWSVFIWTILGFFEDKITIEEQLSSVQFYIMSIYSCAGIEKIIGIYKNKDVVFSQIGLVSSLLTDVYLKFPTFIIDLLLLNVVFSNVIIVGVIFLQVFAAFLFFVIPRNFLAVPFIIFHMMNVFVLGITFFEAVLTLIIFFIIPYLDFKQTNTKKPF